jgi:hypothetical protein
MENQILKYSTRDQYFLTAATLVCCSYATIAVLSFFRFCCSFFRNFVNDDLKVKRFLLFVNSITSACNT